MSCLFDLPRSSVEFEIWKVLFRNDEHYFEQSMSLKQCRLNKACNSAFHSSALRGAVLLNHSPQKTIIYPIL